MKAHKYHVTGMKQANCCDLNVGFYFLRRLISIQGQYRRGGSSPCEINYGGLSPL